MTESTQIQVKKLFSNQDLLQKMSSTMTPQKQEIFKTSLLAIVADEKTWGGASAVSIVQSALVAATLDLPINQNLGFAYILPYNSKDKGKIAQFQMGYKGFIQLAQRTGQYKTISASPVHENQLISNDPLKGITFDWNTKDKGNLVGYVAYFSLINGFEKYLYMSIDQLRLHSKKYSQTAKKGFGLWVDEFDTMAQKTVIKLLISKFGPLSVELQKAIVDDQGVVKPDGEMDFLDNTVDVDSTPVKSELQKFIEEDVANLESLLSVGNRDMDEAEQLAYDKRLEELNKTKSA